MPVEIAELDATTLQNSLNDHNPHELMAEREPRELMDDRNDRTELPDWCIRPPFELEAHWTWKPEAFTRFWRCLFCPS